MQLRSMLRFTIRDVLWLTLVVGLTLGWWVSRERWREHMASADHRARQWEVHANYLAGVLREEGWEVDLTLEHADAGKSGGIHIQRR